ncbi:endospore germination permease [Paenibacillus sp. J5C_2022]|uniref:GerAB/ArcD/ProY family transporter n=1 Tax=Paenibacillus sp. J5C2022 TaxID=2977129 RepID=UPI0021D2A345|nr:endospore germination permease [Paenibacillus sp. J5C2022]MCU6712954.1 endospore germination permease [Paenibacillus sp. J5C2022]
MKSTGISFLHLSAIMLLSIGLMNHVILIPSLLDISKRDAWLAVIITSVLFIPLFWAIAIIAKRSQAMNKPMMEWLAERIGKIPAGIIAVAFVCLLLLSAVTTGKDMKIWTSSTYLPLTPPSVIVLSFIGLCLYLSLHGIRAIALVSVVLLPFVILFGEFVMVANFPHKDYSMLFPIFEYGSSGMWRGIVYAGTGFVEMLYILLLIHYVKRKVKSGYIIVLGLAMAGLTIGPVMGAIAEFGPVEAATQRFPAFEEWRLVRIGNYINHLDFLSIYQWISGAFIRISLAIFLIADLFPARRRTLAACSVALLIAVLIIWPMSDITFLHAMTNYYFPLVFAFMLTLCAVLLILTLIAYRKKGWAGHESESR